MTIRNTLRTIDSQNVVAKLEGRDPQLKNEYVDLHARTGIISASARR